MMDLTAFVCKHEGCNLIYENPVTLPCGNSICEQHLKRYNEKFKCSFCFEEHQIPNTGFTKSKAMIKMIDSHFKLDRLRKKIIESFEILNESIKQCEDINSENYIYSYFFEIRNQVYLYREELKKEIDDKSNEIIEILKEKENKCKSNSQKLQKMNLDELKNNNLPSWKKKIRNPEIRDYELDNLLSKMNQNIQDIEYFIRKFELNSLLNESIKFEKYQKSSLFGKLKIKSERLLLSSCQKVRSYKQHHTKTIRSIQVDEKSNIIISASDDKTLKIWNLAKGKCLKTLKDHQDSVTSILIIPNNKFISGSKDATIKIWDLNSYTCLNTLNNISGIKSLCLISDNQLACGSKDGYINIWNLYNSTKIKTFKAHNYCISYLLLADKTKLISSSDSFFSDDNIKIWSLQSFECIRAL